MAEESRTPDLLIKSQYIKDLSFENPHAPGIYGVLTQNPPQLAINIDVSPADLGNGDYEVTISIRADAQMEEGSAFVAEVEYAGVVALVEDLSEEVKQRLLMVETPRHLFPFARAIIANVTRDGGFPPLVINPIDFNAMFVRRNEEAVPAEEA